MSLSLAQIVLRTWFWSLGEGVRLHDEMLLENFRFRRSIASREIQLLLVLFAPLAVLRCLHILLVV